MRVRGKSPVPATRYSKPLIFIRKSTVFLRLGAHFLLLLTQCASLDLLRRLLKTGPTNLAVIQVIQEANMTSTRLEDCEERAPYGKDVTVAERDGLVYFDGVPFTPEMIAAFSKPDTPRPRRVMTKEEIFSLQVPS